MADEQSDYSDMPSGRIAQLKYSVSNLWDEFGHTSSIGLGFVINSSMVALGILVFVLSSNQWASYAGVVWAIINGYPLLQWVLNG